MTSRIVVLNGPNLNLLGTREPEIYGTATLADVEVLCAETAAKHGLGVSCHQSNHEGGLVDLLHEAAADPGVVGVVLNAAAYTHTSVALLDAVKATRLAVVEVHLSNPHAREEFRHTSYLSPVAVAVIAGAGVQGYAYAVDLLATRHA
ncbi:type II 3-dehydroquinate dehydratase [Ornithinimicrobium tianjinense]|uniref:3-dehydroquinate dehydratase n=1 Tax=Ornithinimicrobium tianjinense TaxID=1195761 RepID=A0A917BH76_9MICO|nr:type II 3-dehydroquinate dehydratase [Ornithinimicrobium tianjinense]GGF45468.1 3-dehydroquinate dehydratase [Ornithinimicrobium tianjinense]